MLKNYFLIEYNGNKNNLYQSISQNYENYVILSFDYYDISSYKDLLVEIPVVKVDSCSFENKNLTFDEMGVEMDLVNTENIYTSNSFPSFTYGITWNGKDDIYSCSLKLKTDLVEQGNFVKII